MISYRKLAMRVLEHPLRVPTNTSRPASHRVTALALTAAMVAGMAAPAYAGTYYIGDGDITITKDEKGDVYVKHADNKDKSKGDVDNGDIIIKGGKRSEDTTAPGGSSSESGTPATSAAKSASATLKVEDSENEDKDMVYPGDTKGGDSSDGSGEENENQSTEKNQTGDTTDGKNTGAGSSDPESKGSDGGTTGSGDSTSGSESGTTGSGDGTTGSDGGISGSEGGGSGSDGTSGSENGGTGGEENDPKPGGTPTPAEGTESTESNRSAPESQFTYTGASLKVASANNDEETQTESSTALKTAADNFKAAAQNVIRIINNLVSNSGKDNTLNVTLDNVNIDTSSSKTNNAALSVEGAGDTKITLVGDNKLTSGNQCAGLEHNGKDYYGSDTGKLTITSGNTDGSNTGSLTATGGGGSAGIGSGWFGNYYGAGTIEITGGDITATGGNNAAGIGSGCDATSDTHIIINGTAKIEAQTEQGGAGIGSGHNSTGNTTIDIGGDAIVKAQGGSDAAGIGSGDDSTGTTTINIKGGTIKEAIGGDGGAGIGGGSVSKNITVNIEGGTIETAQGGQGHGSYDGGSGIHSNGDLTISGKAHIVSATGGNGDSSNSRSDAGDGIRAGTLTISGEAHIDNATGGTADSGSAGSFVNVAGGTINTTGGSGKSGGAGVSTESGIVSIGNSDTPLDLTATAPDADNAIRGRDGKKLDEIIHLEENGKRGLVKLVENGVTRLFHNGVYTKSIYPAVSETHPLGDWVITKKPTCTEPGERQRSCKVEHCVVTETEELPALGHQWSGWMPVQGGSREYRSCTGCGAVEYRDVSHNSGSGDSTISTGLRVLDPAQADILQNAQLVRLSRISDVLYIDVSHETASLQGVLSDLTGLRSERIGTVVFSTERCTSTLSLSDVAALGAGDTPFTLRHSGSTATFTVGGADHSALLR